MTIKTPEGMMNVAEFAKLKSLKPEKVIDMIRDGFYDGRKVGDDWFVDKSELNASGSNIKKKNSSSSPNESDGGEQRVIVTDVQMPFGSMVSFMVKWAIASIPALIILLIIFGIVSAVFGGIFSGFGSSRY